MTIQTYPKNFANLAVPEPPKDSVLVNLADVEAWLKDSTAMHSNILRGNIALTREQAIHIAGLPADIESQLAAANRKIAEMDWKEITPDSLPKVGDEVWSPTRNYYSFYKIGKSTRSGLGEIIEPVGPEDVEDLKAIGYEFTHYRSINPPPIPEEHILRIKANTDAVFKFLNAPARAASEKKTK